MDFVSMLNNRAVLKAECKKLEEKIEGMLSSNWYSQQEKGKLLFFKQELGDREKYMQKLGYSVPQFFVGDLFDIKNYIEYFDSIFYENDIITSQTERKKGCEKLNKLAKGRALERTKGELSWNDDVIVQQCALEIVYEKASALPSTKVLSERLDKEERYLKSVKNEIEEIENKHNLS